MKKKSMHSWGKYPRIENRLLAYEDRKQCAELLQQSNALIACGNGRSYGDSALSETIVDIKPHDYFIAFDEKTGILHVQAGVLLADILEHFVPRGWFLNVVPGTKLITVGGAIASDVHGKNHHLDGCFSQHVQAITLMTAANEIKTCSKNKLKTLFQATCGGQGLTGILLDAKIKLKKIVSSTIRQTTIKTANLLDTFAAFKKLENHRYSVAWIDCLASGEKLGRGIVQAGDFEAQPAYGKLRYAQKSKRNIAINWPRFVLNPWTVRAFNALYYWWPKTGESQQRVSIDSFFFPLDALENWNNIYGKKGFVQYQFILPLENSLAGMTEILEKISQSKEASFLAVLKLYGPANSNYLSFPMEGYSLALDFKVNDKVFALLDELDALLVKHSGRIYLAKDARVSKEVFQQGYPEIEIFRAFRKKHGMDKTFHSAQSKRLDL